MINNNYIENLNIGRNCRFGTQLFQYIFLLAYSLRNDCDIITNKWLGNNIFPSTIPNVNESKFYKSYIFANPISNKNCLDDLSYMNTNIFGPFTNSVHCYEEYIQYIKNALPIDNLMLENVIGIHIRQTDSLNPTNIQNVINWLQSLDLSNKKLFITSEDKSIINQYFSAYNLLEIDYTPTIVTEEELSEEHISMFTDFILLANCPQLFVSKSTYSFAAAFLSPIQQQIYMDKDNNVVLINSLYDESPY